MDAHTLPNKQFAFYYLNRLNDQNLITDEMLSSLSCRDFCRQKFNCSSFPILMEVPMDCSEEELKKLCHIGFKRRYYQERIRIRNRSFVVTNHWYGPNKSMPDNRTPFEQWATYILK